jgi:hypothetical protein
MKKILFTLALVVAVGAASFAQTTDPNAGVFKFKEETWDFGNIPQGTPVKHNFTFTNTGKAPIVIQNVQASCGCTTPTWPKEPILPGKSDVIEVGFNAAAAGGFNKSITITSNSSEPTKMLYIKGTVEAAPKDQTTPEKAPSMLNTTPKN